MGTLRAYRSILSNGNLVKLLAGEFISSIGDWLYLVALLIVVYQESEDPVLLGVIGAARVLPYVILSVPAGIAADRFDRRLILLVTDLARGAIMLGLAALVALDGPLEAIVGLAIAATCFSSFFGPAIGSYLPSLTRDESELGPANSAWATLDNLAFIIGPAVAGLLIALSGLTLAFVLNAISFTFVAAVLWQLPAGRSGGAAATAPAVDPPEGTAADSSRVDAADAQSMRRYLGPLTGLVVIDIVAAVVFGGLGILTVILATEVYGSGEAGTGYLNAAIGVGGLIGAVASGPLVLRRTLSRPLLAGAVGLGLGIVALGVAPGLGPAIVAMVIASAGSLILEVVDTTIFQRVVPDAVRGRALGIIETASTLAYAAGAFALPVLSAVVGTGPVLIVGGVAIIVAGIGGVALLGATATQAPPASAIPVDRITGLPIFAGVPASRMEAIVGRLERISVAAGARIVRQGDVADRFYIIESGCFEVTQRDAAGDSSVLRSMGPDEVFGEIGLLTGTSRSATVTALDDGIVLALNAVDFEELIATGGPWLGPRLLGLRRGAAANRGRSAS
ncbi:MAG: MFS transporter [Chloroflexota bacterium]